jgi:beta-lactam-binding protein with PASTA domain
VFVLGVAVALRALTEDTGPDTAVVPTLAGLTRTTAESRIRAAGFVAQVQRRPGAPPGEVVVRQQPEPGARLSRGSIVGIIVSGRGP